MHARPLRSLVAALVVAALAACNKAPAEPDAPEASAAPPLAPLVWDAPASWIQLDVRPGRPERASYNLGGAAGHAEVHVFFFGTGPGGDPPKTFKQWFGQFDGDAGGGAVREHFKAHGFDVETVEVAGTYKVDMGPQMPGRKQPMQMVKKDYRLLGAVVRTPDRGNWFFKLTGPEEAVQAARSGFHTMLEGVR
jgi:hypothetical protein